LKIVKGPLGLLASVLTLLHGVYLAFYLLWVFVLILIGLRHLAPPVLNPIALAILDMVVYLFLGVGMLRSRRSYFVYAILWTVWGAFLATFAATYKSAVLNLLAFLIVFFCAYYHVSVNRTNAEVAKALGQLAGGLALIQGIIVTFVFTFGYIFLQGWAIPVPPFNQLFLAPSPISVSMAAAIYVVLGVAMLLNKKESYFLAVFWTIVESALAVADSSYTRTHFNFLSILILAFATYCYFAKAKA